MSNLKAMLTALIQYALSEEVYRNLLFMCSKRGYKIKTVDKVAGTIKAEKKKLFSDTQHLFLTISSTEKDIVKIIIEVTRKEKIVSAEEEKIRETLFKYF